MKILLIGSLLLLVLVAMLFLFFYRIGKPIDDKISRSYFHHAWKRKIVYAPMGNWFELDYQELNADIPKFLVLSEDFAKDAISVFFKGRKQVANASSFYVDEFRIPKDKNYVYRIANLDTAIEIVKGADPHTYVLMAEEDKTYVDPLYRDSAHYFFYGEQLEVDYASFVRLNETIFIDQQFLYTLIQSKDKTMEANKIVRKDGRPAGLARAINQHYAQIGNTIVLSNWKNELAIQSFRVIDSITVIDPRNIVVDNQWLSDGILLAGVDAATVEIIDRDYVKDKTNVFYNGQPIASADASSFEVIFEAYSKDRNRVYYNGKELAGAKPTNFTYDYTNETATDGMTTYREGVAIKK